MAFSDTYNRLEQLAFLIQRKSTGSPEVLACRLRVSRRTVYNLIDILKNQGADIEYCRERSSYYYTRSFKISFQIFAAKRESGATKDKELIKN